HSLDDFETIPPCPNFVYEAVEAPRQRATAASGLPRANGAMQPDDRAYKYARAALENERSQLAKQASGGRNAKLNNAALKIGSLAHYGAFSEDEARAALHGACVANGLIADDGLPAFEATFDSGWTAGTAQPRETPEGDHAPDRISSDRVNHERQE